VIQFVPTRQHPLKQLLRFMLATASLLAPMQAVDLTRRTTRIPPEMTRGIAAQAKSNPVHASISSLHLQHVPVPERQIARTQFGVEKQIVSLIS